MVTTAIEKSFRRRMPIDAAHLTAMYAGLDVPSSSFRDCHVQSGFLQANDDSQDDGQKRFFSPSLVINREAIEHSSMDSSLPRADYDSHC